MKGMVGAVLDSNYDECCWLDLVYGLLPLDRSSESTANSIVVCGSFHVLFFIYNFRNVFHAFESFWKKKKKKAAVQVFVCVPTDSVVYLSALQHNKFYIHIFRPKCIFNLLSNYWKVISTMWLYYLYILQCLLF